MLFGVAALFLLERMPTRHAHLHEYRGCAVARIEGAMSGPWRPPANGTPAPSTAPGDAMSDRKAACEQTALLVDGRRTRLGWLGSRRLRPACRCVYNSQPMPVHPPWAMGQPVPLTVPAGNARGAGRLLARLQRVSVHPVLGKPQVVQALVIGRTTGTPVSLLKASGETISTGRVPCCS